MAKVKKQQAEVKFKYEVKTGCDNLTIMCGEGTIKLGETQTQKVLKYVFDEIEQGPSYIKRMPA